MVIRWHLTGSPIKDTLENEKETLTQIKQQWLKKKKKTWKESLVMPQGKQLRTQIKQGT